MKTTQNYHPLVSASTRHVDNSSDDNIKSKEPIICLKLDKPSHWDWQLTTTADKLPVIELVDKDGKLLVKTSGRVAQRARGSFRDGLKYHESFPKIPSENKIEAVTETEIKSITGNRNYDGFSTKHGSVFFGNKPRKSRSEATLSSSSSSRHMRKRHSSNESRSENSRQSSIYKERTSNNVDNLCQNDLFKRNAIPNLSSGDIEMEKFKKTKECSRIQSNNIKQGTNSNKLLTINLKDVKTITNKENEDKRNGPKLSNKNLTNQDLHKIRSFLQEKIQAKMQEEILLQQTHSFPIKNNGQFYKDNDKTISTNVNTFEKTQSHSDHQIGNEEFLSNSKMTQRVNNNNLNLDSKLFKKLTNELKTRQQNLINQITQSDRVFPNKVKRDVLNCSSKNNICSETDNLVDYTNPIQEISNKNNFERSWREYTERKKQEQLLKELDHQILEEDFMMKPRWKDFQATSCRLDNCKVCENMKDCMDLKEYSDTANNTHVKKNNAKPNTSLQENYLMIDSSDDTQSKELIMKKCKNNDNITQLDHSCYNFNTNIGNIFKTANDGENINEFAIGDICTNEEIIQDYCKRIQLLYQKQKIALKEVENPSYEKYKDTFISPEDTQIKKRQWQKNIDKLTNGN
jgi:hypothetical protein